MAYATVDELAQALGVRVTDANTEALEACLEAAAEEIDHDLDRGDELLPVPPPFTVNRCNINRAVEWWKSPAAYNGGVGFDQTGPMPAPPDGFDRHAATITRWKIGWGIA
jgi:hypothetical protein